MLYSSKNKINVYHNKKNEKNEKNKINTEYMNCIEIKENKNEKKVV